MPKTRSDQNQSSLELLLDTICNTFGCILLISLVVALLVNQSSDSASKQPATKASALEFANLELERVRITSELAALNRSIDEQPSVNLDYAIEEMKNLQTNLADLEKRKREALLQDSAAQGTLNKLQQTENEIDQESRDRDERVNAARKLADALRKKIEEAVAQRSGEAVIPKEERETRKLQSVFYVKNNRLYGPYLANDELNGVDIGGGNKRIEITNTKLGLDLMAKNVGPKIEEKFNAYLRPSSHVAYIAIWGDCYTHWSEIRRALSRHGIRYLLVPMTEDDRVQIGNFSGDSSSQG